MRGPAAQPGCFGKLPCVGDFLRRRLPDEFVLPWDDWLQSGLMDSRERLGEDFGEMFLTFSIWRFMCPPGVVGADAWIGVMMPSNDRVGRLFPMTIAEPLSPGQLMRERLGAVEQRLDALAELGLAALDLDDASALDPLLEAVERISTDVDSSDRDPSEPRLECGSRRGAWRFEDGLAHFVCWSGEATIVASLDQSMLWWLPPDVQGPGVLLREPVPLRSSLLHDLIMPDASQDTDDALQ